jgi:PAS domain S-box-containing protein
MPLKWERRGTMMPLKRERRGTMMALDRERSMEAMETSTKSEIDVSFYKSIVDQDRAAVVICDLDHKIIYMNPAAVQNYGKKGGDKLIGRSLLDCHNPKSAEKIQQVIDWFSADESHNIVYTYHNAKQNKDVYMVALRDAGKLIGYYEKHEYRNEETMQIFDLR